MWAGRKVERGEDKVIYIRYSRELCPIFTWSITLSIIHPLYNPAIIYRQRECLAWQSTRSVSTHKCTTLAPDNYTHTHKHIISCKYIISLLLQHRIHVSWGSMYMYMYLLHLVNGNTQPTILFETSFTQYMCECSQLHYTNKLKQD